MASVRYAEAVVDGLSNTLSSNVKTKFTNSDTGYAAENGSLENGTIYSVIEIDETNSRVVSITNKAGTYTCECTFPTGLSTTSSGQRAANAFKAMS